MALLSLTVRCLSDRNAPSRRAVLQRWARWMVATLGAGVGVAGVSKEANAAHCFWDRIRDECRRDNSCQTGRRTIRVYREICCPPAGSCYHTGHTGEARYSCCGYGM